MAGAFLSRMALRRVPWRTVWAAAIWLAREGRKRLEKNLSPAERARFWELMRKARARPMRNLTQKERQELTRVVREAVLGRK